MGIVAALCQRNTIGRGQKVLAAMQDGVLNLCRVELCDHQRLAHGPLKEYPQYPKTPLGPAVPRAGNASGGGQPGWILKCKVWETDPSAYIDFITQVPVWARSSRTPACRGWTRSSRPSSNGRRPRPIRGDGDPHAARIAEIRDSGALSAGSGAESTRRVADAASSRSARVAAAPAAPLLCAAPPAHSIGRARVRRPGAGPDTRRKHP